VYLPLSDFSARSPEMLMGLEQIDVVCLDDIDQLAGHPQREEAFFDCYNRVRDAGGKLIVTAAAAPKALGVALPDLVSRLSWGLTFHLHPLIDDEKIAALMLRAMRRGFELPKEVANFVLSRSARDNKALFHLLDQLDYASLAAQRRLTIPFVKTIIGS
jgi:DnaA family protein